MPTTAAAADSAARVVRDHVGTRLDGWLDRLGELVAIDSGADAPEGIAAVQQVLVRELTARGAVTAQTWVDGVPHLRATVPGEGPVVAVVGHADTVFGLGSTADRPMTVHGRRVDGPGTADMKGGLASVVAVVAALQDHGIAHPTLEVLIYGDEETRHVPPPHLDSPVPAACLVLECGRPGGGYVAARKAGAWVTLGATGAAAHAGVDPDRGRNAIVALAGVVVGIAACTDRVLACPRPVGRIRGGTAVKAVPATAQVEVDVRAPTTAPPRPRTSTGRWRTCAPCCGSGVTAPTMVEYTPKGYMVRAGARHDPL